MPGLEDSHKIDIVTHDERSDEIVLIIQEPGRWTADAHQQLLLQDKIDTYVDYVLEGKLVEEQPMAEGKPVRIRAEFRGGVDKGALAYLKSIKRSLELQNIRFQVQSITRKA